MSFFWLCLFIKVIFIFKNSMLILLTYLQPVCFYSIPVECIRKSLVFWYFQGLLDIGLKNVLTKYQFFVYPIAKQKTSWEQFTKSSSFLGLVRDRLQVSVLTLNAFDQINHLLMISIHLYFVNYTTSIWRWILIRLILAQIWAWLYISGCF